VFLEKNHSLDANRLAVSAWPTAEVDTTDERFIVFSTDNVFLVKEKLFSQNNADFQTPNNVPLEFLREKFGKDQLSSLVFVADCLTDQIITDQTLQTDHNLHELRYGRSIVGYAIRHGNQTILNIDHHADAVEMQRAVSATTLAFIKITRHRRDISHIPIVITHTDTDSILSAALLRNKVPLEFLHECTQAVIAADHTGAQTDLGDLLQVTEGLQDLTFSLRLVENYFIAKKQAKAQQRSFDLVTFLNSKYPRQNITIQSQNQQLSLAEALEQYREKRNQVSELFATTPELNDPSRPEVHRIQDDYELTEIGQGVFAVTDTKIVPIGEPPRPVFPTEYLNLIIPPELRQKARVVIFSRPRPILDQAGLVAGYLTNQDGKYIQDYKTVVMPDQIGQVNLKKLNLEEFGWGGRHNMGSNARITGEALMKSTKNAVELGRIVAERLAA
jgi:hypothetical protein